MIGCPQDMGCIDIHLTFLLVTSHNVLLDCRCMNQQKKNYRNFWIPMLTWSALNAIKTKMSTYCCCVIFVIYLHIHIAWVLELMFQMGIGSVVHVHHSLSGMIFVALQFRILCHYQYHNRCFKMTRIFLH